MDSGGVDGTESSLTVAGTITANNINVYGGGAGGSGHGSVYHGGGGGGGAYAGGAGGYLHFNDNTYYGGAPNGGRGGTNAGYPVAWWGGNGGDATLTITDEVELSGDINVFSGETPNETGVPLPRTDGVGGAATFTVGKLTAAGSGTRHFVFTKRGGDLTVDIGTLELSQSDVSITLTNTAATDVKLGNLIFNEGRSFSVSGSGTMTAGHITVLGTGAVMNLGVGITYNASGKILRFIVPDDYDPSADGALLTVIDGKLDITGATMSVELNANTANFKEGDEITLVAPDSASPGTITGAAGSTILTRGLGIKHLTLEMLLDGRLHINVLRIGGAGVSATLVEGSAAVRAGLLYQRASTMTGYIHTLSTKPHSTPAGWTTFASVGGFDENLDTGHSLDLRGFTFAVGGVKYWNLGAGRVFAGLAAEGGRGNYTASVSTESNSYRGDGRADYAGGSFFARLELPRLINLDASFSLGGVGSDFRSAEYDGREAFASRTAYLAAHIGVDKTFAFTPLNSVTVFSRLQYTRQSSDSFTTIAGETVRLDAFSSTYGSLGARYERSITPRVKAYAGAAWEYEFGGKAKASLDGERLDNLSRLRGHSGTGELGIAMRARECGGFEADISLRGRVGKRRGVAAGVTLGYSF